MLYGVGWVGSSLNPVEAAVERRLVEALRTRFAGARLEGPVRIDGTFRVVAGPIVVPAKIPGGIHLLTVREVTARPHLLSLLSGRLEVGDVRLRGVRLEAGYRGEALADLMPASRPAQGSPAATPRGPPPSVQFEELLVRVGLDRDRPDSDVSIGPLSGRAAVERSGDATTADVAVWLPGTGRAELRLFWRDGGFSVEARAQEIGPEALPEKLRARLPLQVSSGALAMSVDASRTSRLEPITGQLSASLEDATISWSALSPRPVGPITIGISGSCRLDLRGERFSLESGSLSFGQSRRTTFALSTEFKRRPEPELGLTLSAEAIDWEAIVSELPPALGPPPQSPPIQGAFAIRLTASGPLRDLSAWRLEGDVDRVGLRPAQLRKDSINLNAPFAYQAQLSDGGVREVIVGPENRAFVPLDTLPNYLLRAVTASEDASFFSHGGFDMHEIQAALARTGGHRRLRGASTITQQLAKNLFLSSERTLARKGREALATLALETSVGKRRLLEIYLNTAEWGPGIFGIGEASHHWFGKDARTLTPKEAAFLATVIPNPVRYDMYRRRGGLTEHWEERVGTLLGNLRAAGVLNDDQFMQAMRAPLIFRPG